MISHLPRSAVHDVLWNPSLASEILSFVTVDPTRPNTDRDLKTCLAFALSCKSLLEPALDELWSRLEDLKPLFQLISGLEYVNDKILTDKPLENSQLKRVEYHAHRVRYLTLSFGMNPRPLTWAEPSLLVQLLLLLHGQPLLPCLRYLSIADPISQEQAAILSVILPLIPCSTLRHVCLIPVCYQTRNARAHIPSDAFLPPVMQFLNTLATIPHLNLQALIMAPLTNVHASILFRRFPRSKHLSFPFLHGRYTGPSNLASLHHFHLLESLSTLDLGLIFQRCDASISSASLLSSIGPLTFHSLEALTLTSNIFTIAQLFTLCKFPCLKKLVFVASPLLTLDDTKGQNWQRFWDDFVEKITEEGKTLDVLSIVRHSQNINLILPWFSFTPLLRLKGLTSLILLGVKFISFSNQVLTTLANCSPHLQILEFDVVEISPDLLQSLVEIRRRLFSLKRLALPLDWRTACPSILPHLPSYNSKHPLSSLNILRIPNDYAAELRRVAVHSMVLQEQCERFADFLFALFPDVGFSTSQSVGIDGLEGIVMHYLAECKAKDEPETDSESESDGSQYEDYGDVTLAQR